MNASELPVPVDLHIFQATQQDTITMARSGNINYIFSNFTRNIDEQQILTGKPKVHILQCKQYIGV